jgi:hypothetical protein
MVSIPWGDVGGWAAFGALSLAMLMLVVTGKLVPRRTHDREMARADAEIARLNREVVDWRGAWHITDAANREEAAGDIQEIKAGLRTIKSVVRAVSDVGNDVDAEDESDGRMDSYTRRAELTFGERRRSGRRADAD